MASVAATMIRGVGRRKGQWLGVNMPAAVPTPEPAGACGRPARDPIDAATEASILFVNSIMASPRAFSRSAGRVGCAHDRSPGAAPWDSVGAAHLTNSPPADGIPESPASARMTIAVRRLSPRPPESSTQKDAATEQADIRSALDTDVAFAKIHVVDDPRDSGARKHCPGVFIARRGPALCGPVPNVRFGN